MILVGQYDSPFVRRVVDEPHRRNVLRIEAVALGLTEKLYEIIFEFARRDPEKCDPAIVARAERQISSALAWLAALLPSPRLYGNSMSRADVAAEAQRSSGFCCERGLVGRRRDGNSTVLGCTQLICPPLKLQRPLFGQTGVSVQ